MDSFSDLPATGKFRETNSYAHTIEELDRALDINDDYDREVGMCIIKLMEVFSDQDHSGFSASMVSSIFNKLSRFEPLTPLTGDDNEWIEISDDQAQNKRASNVFKDLTTGVAYQYDYYVFKDEHGSSYTSKNSRKYIEFPYVVGHEYVPYEPKV